MVASTDSSTTSFILFIFKIVLFKFVALENWVHVKNLISRIRDFNVKIKVKKCLLDIKISVKLRIYC